MCHYMYFAVVVMVIGVVATSDECGENARYDPCPPTNCPRGQACTAVCRPACVCNTGYRYNSEHVCEKVQQLKCSANETMVECANGCIFEDCPVADQGPPPACSPPEKCLPGCTCSKGYNRLEGKCVLKKDCNVDCGEHGYYSNCTNPCPEGAVCAVPCLDGCLCEDGHSNVGRYGKCVEDSCE